MEKKRCFIPVESEIISDSDSLLMVIERCEFYDNTTIGQLFIEDKINRFCWTLEDAVRPIKNGIIEKIKGKTAIPFGIYRVEFTFSPRFNKSMPIIFNMTDYSIECYGIKFEGVRFHGGNTNEDTEGCPLIALNHNIGEERIQGSASDKFNALMQKLLIKYTNIYVKIC